MMKIITKTISFISFLIMIAISACQTVINGGDFTLSTRQDSLSYAYGMLYQEGSQGFGKMGITLNADKYLEGFKAMQSGDPDFTMDNSMNVLMKFSKTLSIRQGQPFTEEDPYPMSVDSLSMALGAYDSYSYKGCGYEANGEAICAGIKESKAGLGRFDNYLSEELGQAFQINLSQARQADHAAKAGPNKAKGDQFLAENKTKEGVQVTESGLQYKVIRTGTGISPTGSQTVTVHYEGRTIDGTIFDSSYKRGETIDFPINGVIAGWTEGLQLMKVGAKYQLFVHSDLAYGMQGSGVDIGPNETLIFDLELLDVK